MRANCVFSSLSFVALITMWVISRKVVFNQGVSEIQGYYFTYANSTYQKGDMVLVCITSLTHIRMLHVLRLPIFSGECANNMPYLLKHIVAVENDLVEITSAGVYVNNFLHENSVPLTRYKRIKLPKLNLLKFRLRTGEFFVLGNTSHSYDSRYFGVITHANLHSHVKLIFQTSINFVVLISKILLFIDSKFLKLYGKLWW
jgi:conjugative transfer signal peptidase TraF